MVSVLMAAWRPRPEWLRVAVESILAERDVDLELVVVDDGSPEPVAALLEDVRDPRLRVVRVEHAGESAARNVGIGEARGSFVRFADADDAFTPRSTARLLALAADDAIAYGATTMCDAQLRERWTMTSRLEGDVEVECLLGRFTVRVPAMVFPRRVVEAAGDWDTAMRVSSDWDWTLRALEHAPVRGETAPALLYRKHAAGATRDATAGEHGATRVVDKYFERHPELRGTRLERLARARVAALSARAYLTRGALPKALRSAARAATLDPLSLVEEGRRGLARYASAAPRIAERSGER